MQGSGEQQEGQHAVEDRLTEVSRRSIAVRLSYRATSGSATSMPIRISEAPRAMTRRPIVWGRRMTTWLSQPNTAVRTRRMATRSKAEGTGELTETTEGQCPKGRLVWIALPFAPVQAGLVVRGSASSQRQASSSPVASF